MELIVFDLDGTLLDANSEISPYTRETLALLSAHKIAYTVATGRTLHSAKQILHGHDFQLPHIYSNGVLIWDPQGQYLRLENTLSLAEAQHVITAAKQQGTSPFVSTVETHQQHWVYHPRALKPIENRLLADMQARPEVHLGYLEALSNDAIITNISMLGSNEAIGAIENSMHNETHLVAYSGPALEGNGLKWMDIHHSQANKGSAVALLREQLGISKVICFGDNNNDLSMFAMADESYAPSNAKAHIKAAATAVIGHHDQDGIARFLRHRFKLS